METVERKMDMIDTNIKTMSTAFERMTEGINTLQKTMAEPRHKMPSIPSPLKSTPSPAL